MAAGAEDHASVEPREALTKLTDADWLRLEKFARYQVFRYASINAQEVLNEAVLRVLRHGRRCRPGLEFVQFLRGAIRSIADEFREREKAVMARGSVEVGSPAPVECTTDQLGCATLERQTQDKQLIERIWNLFADDEHVQRLLMGAEQGMTGIEIQEQFGLTANDYGAARKRLERRLARYLKENEL